MKLVAAARPSAPGSGLRGIDEGRFLPTKMAQRGEGERGTRHGFFSGGDGFLTGRESTVC